ncbi:MAG TPA: hypothetical protein VKU00_14280 [Chthonomonadaceae bacterium]|nr:hypothetical protein [Chthonomonadaceae bacterium]
MNWISANKEAIGLWIGAICTLGLYSVLYKENKLYRLFEHIFLGLATGFGVAATWNEVLKPKWWEPIWVKGQWWWILTLVAGLLYYFIYSRKYNWLARAMIGFFLGVASGQSFQGFVNDLWPQIRTSFKPLIPHALIAKTADHPAIKAVTLPDAINNLIFMVTLLCVMSYFFFSFEQKHPVQKGMAKMGRWLMMFTFGAIFGSTIMARLALLIDRMDYLLNDFGPRIGGPVVMFGLLMALTVLLLVLVTAQKQQTDAETE